MRFIPIVISLVCGCTPGSAPPSAPVALTPLEYNHTVRDLLDLPDDGARWPAAPDVVARLAGPQRGPTGVDFVAQDDRPWPWPFPEEPGVDGFDGMAPGQSPLRPISWSRPRRPPSTLPPMRWSLQLLSL